MPWWLVERWEALRLALGARGALPREVGTLIPPPRVPIGALAPPTAPPLAQVRGTGKPRTHQRRENVEVWLFEIVDRILSKTLQHIRVIRGLDPPARP